VVGSFVISHVVGSFESFQEFEKYLLFGFLSGLNIRVSLGCVDTGDVVDVNIPVAILVKFLEGLGDNLAAEIIHGSSKNAKEFVVLDQAIT